MIITPFAYMAKKAPLAAPILDSYPGAEMAYSVRLLRTAYTGSCLRVRRDNDNATQDIGFSSGVLNTVALASFVGANSGYVDIWYDQSGNNHHMTQTTISRQPRIVNAGIINTATGNPAIDFYRGGIDSDVELGTPITTGDTFSILYAGSKGGQANAYLFGGNATASRPAMVSNYSGVDLETLYSADAADRQTISSTGMTSTDIYLVATSRNYPGNIVGRFDGSQVFNTATAAGVASGNIDVLGSAGNTSFGWNQFGEFILYLSDEAANLSGMQDNQNTYWTKY